GGCGCGGCGDGDCEGDCDGDCDGDCEGGGCHGGCHDEDKKTSSDNEGSFEFIITEPGRYVISASHDDFENARHFVSVEVDEDAEIEIVMNTPLDVTSDSQFLPVETCIVEAYPNPFNSSFAITISLQESGLVKAEIFDLSGRLVQSVSEGQLSAGSHVFNVQGNDLASGVYLLKVQTPGTDLMKKVCLIR
ncbi:MAG: T9SS type A sorting domain-containing protein, partial [Calditrichaeota bacterium]|nr:T9SS type A sorting domain-containing protein [Calditrichota bacterium]